MLSKPPMTPEKVSVYAASRVRFNYSYSISATISCIHIVRATSYLVWIFCQIRLIHSFSESFVDKLETIVILANLLCHSNTSLFKEFSVIRMANFRFFLTINHIFID